MESGSRSFALKIGFKPETSDPGRVFRAMNDLIESVEGIDSLLAKVVSADVDSELVLEDVRSGSIVGWFRQNVKTKNESIYDDDNPEQKIENFINMSNGEIFKSISDGSASYSDIEDMIDRLNSMAKDTDVLQLDGYGNVPISDMISYLEGISNAVKNLSDGDSASYIGIDSEEVTIDTGIDIDQDDYTKEMSESKIVNESEMILRVKKPDYIESSQWIFKHSKGNFRAKIKGEDWLSNFQSREIELRPGDSVRAIVEIETLYDKRGEVISENRVVKKVLNVMGSEEEIQEDLDI